MSVRASKFRLCHLQARHDWYSKASLACSVQTIFDPIRRGNKPSGDL